jgi:hypothetical protein
VALAAVVLPFVASAWDAGARRALEALARLLVVLVLALLARAAVLRAREVDADLVSRQASPAALRSALSAGTAASPAASPVRAAVADHPTPAARRAIVDDTRRACRLHVTDAVLVGLTTATAAPIITRLVRGWFQFGDPAFYADLIGWSITGGLIGAWLAAMMLRAVTACRNEGRELALGWFGAGSAAALLVGGYVLGTPLLLPVRSLPSTLTGIGGSVILALGLVALAVWLRGACGWWLDAPLARRSRRMAVLVPALLGGLLGALVLGVLKHVEGLASNLDENPELLGDSLDPAEPFTLISLLLSEAETWVVLALAVVAVGVPVVLVWLASRPASTVPAWMRSAVPEDLERDGWTEVPVAWRGAAGVGVAAGAFAAACYATYVVVWDPVGTVAERGWWPSVQMAFASQSIVGVVAGVGAATAALLVQRARVPLAGLAGGVAGLVGGVGAWVVQWIDAGEADAEVLDDVVLDVVVVAVIVAVVLGAVAALLPRPRTIGSGRLLVALAAPALAAIALVAAGVAARDAVPTTERDAQHYAQVLERVTTDETVAALNACDQGTLTAAQAQWLGAVRAQLVRPFSTPSTDAVLAAHAPLIRALDACGRGDVGGFRAELATFVDAARALGILS